MNYHSDEWIMERVKKHYDYLELFYDPTQILGIFYKDSANYGLDWENSDVDTVAVILPTIGQLINREKISKEISFEKEIIACYDIKTFSELLLKSNEVILQTLFTKYKIVNYTFFWKMLTNRKEEIALYNPKQLYKMLEGQIYNQIEKFYKLGYEDKNFINIVKLVRLLHSSLYLHKYELGMNNDRNDILKEYILFSAKGDYIDRAQDLCKETLETIEASGSEYINITISEEIIKYVKTWVYQTECWYLKQADWGLLYD